MLSFSKKCGIKNIQQLFRLGAGSVLNRPIRSYSGSSDECEKTKKEPKCGRVVSGPCAPKPPKQYEPKARSKRPELVSMWKIDDCEPDICVLPLRYDMKYYSISDKSKRKYQVTWNECPRMLIKPRKVCLYDKIVRPRIKRRKRTARGSSATAAPPKFDCGKGAPAKRATCVYVTNPCCRVGRRPPKCARALRSLGSCQKRKPPYPSFSECKKDDMIPLPPTECRCLDLPALCDAWATLRRRLARGMDPIKKCGDA